MSSKTFMTSWSQFIREGGESGDSAILVLGIIMFLQCSLVQSMLLCVWLFWFFVEN